MGREFIVKIDVKISSAVSPPKDPSRAAACLGLYSTFIHQNIHQLLLAFALT